jgi:hypothetical protein
MTQGPLLYVDLRRFRDLAINFRAVEPELYAAMRTRLKAAGMLVADEARRNAQVAKLESIAPAIKVQIQGLSVYVGTPRTPIAALEEYSPGRWSHPIFGQGTTVQEAHPYLEPALEARGAVAAEEISTAVTEALDAAFKE